ncbi:alpha/beta hydrolase [Nocardia sp. JMUB6875]|uniref:poly(ethylene terephthalate) hydrolase family protein n=1 Tax=Nocardia sp. JMUB6875 TaxID=3158170 RepID=UPI0032E7B935
MSRSGFRATGTALLTLALVLAASVAAPWATAHDPQPRVPQPAVPQAGAQPSVVPQQKPPRAGAQQSILPPPSKPVAPQAATPQAGVPKPGELPPGITAQAVFGAMGPYAVASTAVLHPCKESIWGFVQELVIRAFGNNSEPTCTYAFPQGGDSPIAVTLYYPQDIRDLSAAPPIVFVPGIDSDVGMHDASARHWASHGFVVALASDFSNSLLEMPALGLATVVSANRDEKSPLHGKVDLSRTVFAGHSAGGQAAQQSGAAFPAIAHLIDPQFKVAAVMALEPGPLALGSMISVPTLMLTGHDDFVVFDVAWPRLWQYNLVNAPAYLVNAKGATHFNPLDDLEHNKFTGIMMAWLLHITMHDETAGKFFLGPEWLLPSDTSFLEVYRNEVAERLH